MTIMTAMPNNAPNMKLGIILGTRPEIIKMSPVIRAAKRRGVDFFVLHTGQHYSKELDEQMFADLELDAPKYNLGVGGQPYRKQIGLMTREIKLVLEVEKPYAVVVQGDTISVLAGALAANKLNIKVAHHEAGLRSHDLAMLEETNRIITDHVSDFLFVPTPDALKNLHQEGRETDRIHFTGNTIVDAVEQNLEIAEKRSDIIKRLGLTSKGYMLVTAHRAENVDNEERLRSIMASLAVVGSEYNVPLVFPMHPRTRNKLAEFKVSIPKEITVIDPVGFLESILLQKHARLVMTDSGGLQEESFILRVPCVTLRDNTERPETVEYGANIVAGVLPESVLAAVRTLLEKKNVFSSPDKLFGDGKAGERIIDILLRHHTGVHHGSI